MSAVLAIAQPHRIKRSHRRRGKVTSGRFVQRYYDPMIGRFLSVDPMESDMDTGWNFNRYYYAANNPYKFTDPDGRCSGAFCDRYREVSKMCEMTCVSTRENSTKNADSRRSRERRTGFGEVLLRIFAGSAATNASMKSTHPSRIDQKDANKIAIQSKTITTAGAAGIASAPIVAPVAAETIVATAGVVGPYVTAKTAREVLYGACIVVGACNGNNPSSGRVRQQERIEEGRAGARRETQREELELPDPKP
ncbi:MAG: RHS repeat-associated core domain-containing protein [Arenimonas sp.]